MILRCRNAFEAVSAEAARVRRYRLQVPFAARVSGGKKWQRHTSSIFAVVPRWSLSPRHERSEMRPQAMDSVLGRSSVKGVRQAMAPRLHRLP
jgi:hypothetical protein